MTTLVNAPPYGKKALSEAKMLLLVLNEASLAAIKYGGHDRALADFYHASDAAERFLREAIGNE